MAEQVISQPFFTDVPDAQTIADFIFQDLTKVFNLNPGSLFHGFLKRYTRRPAVKFAEILLRLDHSLGEGDIRKSSKLALDYFTAGQEFIGDERVPREGPLLVVANHPGSADSIGAFSCVCRTDGRVVAGRRPMLEVLPNISRHLIYLNADPVDRMGVIREIISRLKNGESVILFPRGSLESDPALLPGALQSIKDWHDSMGLFLAKVPETKLLPMVISQTVSPKALKNFFVQRAKTQKRRHQIAMIAQFAMQRLQPDKGWKIPLRIQVGQPYLARDLSGSLDPREINESIKHVMSELLVSAYPSAQLTPTIPGS